MDKNRFIEDGKGLKIEKPKKNEKKPTMPKKKPVKKPSK